jgi:ATP-binding cassette, subfamily G (WHITE), member 2, PDR
LRRLDMSSSDGSSSQSTHSRMAAVQEDQTETSKLEPVLTHQDVGSTYSSDQSAIAATTQQNLPASLPHSVTTRIAQESELHRSDTTDGLQREDPRLNPSDAAFDFHLWARYFIRALEKDGIRPSRSGFVFKDLNVLGSGSSIHLQQNVGSIFRVPFGFKARFKNQHSTEKLILKDFNGAVRQGQMLLVLGRPGSGCTTFLKSICGQMQGLKMSNDSIISYDGIPQKIYHKEFRGEILYNQETEKHFPHLTVAQTLQFAAAARTPSFEIMDMSRKQFSTLKSEVAMSLFGLSHVRSTKVGNDFIRGVSGGERKRVSIAEMAVSGASIGAWDNSTRGLDAATALDFVRTLKTSSQTMGTTHAVALYQASQSIYDVFDTVIVLYEGRQIYFGPCGAAKAYFENMGWLCPSRQTTGDFLTSVTNPSERRAKPGCEHMVPRTAVEFERYWQKSPEYSACRNEIDTIDVHFPVGGPALENSRKAHRMTQGKHTRKGSPYRNSIASQVKLCITRSYQRMWNDWSSTASLIVAQIIQALIIGSIFYGTPQDTNGFFAQGSVLFFAVFMNTLASVSEITTLFNQRPIVEKHKTYAFYHPFAEGLADIIAYLPVKFLTSVAFNVILYFLGDLRREAGPFFIYFLFVFTATLAMSAIFRTIAASSKAIPQAMAFAGVLLLAIAIYTGFTLQTAYMHPWLRWVGYINPIAYAYEAILVNQVHDRSFSCAISSLVPPYGEGDFVRCAIKGSELGQKVVSGDAWASASYGYEYAHLWRNYGILVAFMAFFYVAFLLATEFNSNSTSTAEFLVFRRGHVPAHLDEKCGDVENDRSFVQHDDGASTDNGNEKQLEPTSIPRNVFSWCNVSLTVPVKGGQRQLLDGVSGWVKPGTLTALMGVSGAGKTTLLDTLAQRISVGVITGDMLVNGQPLDPSFQRNTGYVQQQGL